MLLAALLTHEAGVPFSSIIPPIFKIKLQAILVGTVFVCS
jgi:hypothetical protein